MSFDSAQKISDIVFKGIIATAASVIAVYMTWQKNSGDLIKQCDSFYTALIDYAAATTFSDSAKQHLTFRINNYNKMCEPKLDDVHVQALLNVLVPAAPPKQPSQPADPVTQPPNVAVASEGLKGWVALSRIPANQYADTNFDGVTGTGKFSAGDIIKARWSVNIRQKNTPVSRGDNPVLGTIEGGACLKIEERVSGQLNEWARISQQECPR
jgi:hypothetical protein